MYIIIRQLLSKEFYVKNGKYKAIHGMGTVDSIFETISKALDEFAR